MSDSGVFPNRMDGPYDLDDANIEALIVGTGHATDPALADLLSDLRVSYTSLQPAVGGDLAALLSRAVVNDTEPSSTTSRRIHARIAKLAAAAAVAIVAATSGLAVAGALPAAIQKALSDIGVPSPAHGPSHHHPAPITPASATTTTVDPTTTTVVPTTTTVVPTTTTVADTTPLTAQPDPHGTDVSGVAHTHDSTGCAHGHDVADVASQGKSNGQPCHTTSTTIAPNNHAQNGHGNNQPPAATPPGSSNGGDHNRNATRGSGSGN